MNIGGAPLNVANSRQAYHTSAPVPSSSFAPSVVPSPAQTPQAPALPLSTSSTPIPLHGTSDPNNSNSSVRVATTNLVKPSSFFAPPSSASLMIPPISSSLPTVTGLQAPPSLQRPYGTPLLQPFPPPTPPPSLTPNSSPTPVNNGPLITRDKVRDALLLLVQVSLSISCSLSSFSKHWSSFQHFRHLKIWCLSFSINYWCFIWFFCVRMINSLICSIKS